MRIFSRKGANAPGPQTAGAVDFPAKPVERTTLLDALQRGSGRSRVRGSSVQPATKRGNAVCVSPRLSPVAGGIRSRRCRHDQ
jgi:hypothetical protein